MGDVDLMANGQDDGSRLGGFFGFDEVQLDLAGLDFRDDEPFCLVWEDGVDFLAFAEDEVIDEGERLAVVAVADAGHVELSEQGADFAFLGFVFRGVGRFGCFAGFGGEGVAFLRVDADALALGRQHAESGHLIADDAGGGEWWAGGQDGGEGKE